MIFSTTTYILVTYNSACNSVVDEDGLRYLLLCRVILGKTELVQIGSEQCHPSSEEFHSGVDNLAAPGKYIVWSTNMNTHILPEFVVSFRAPSCLAGEKLAFLCVCVCWDFRAFLNEYSSQCWGCFAD